MGHACVFVCVLDCASSLRRAQSCISEPDDLELIGGKRDWKADEGSLNSVALHLASKPR